MRSRVRELRGLALGKTAQDDERYRQAHDLQPGRKTWNAHEAPPQMHRQRCARRSTTGVRWLLDTGSLSHSGITPSPAGSVADVGPEADLRPESAEVDGAAGQRGGRVSQIEIEVGILPFELS